MVQLTAPPLLGRPVVLTNQDIFLADAGWHRLGALLTPGRALMPHTPFPFPPQEALAHSTAHTSLLTQAFDTRGAYHGYVR